MSDAIGKPSAESEPKRRSRLADFLMRLLKEKPLGTFCGMILLLLIFVAIFADVLAPYPYKEMHLIDRLQGPSSQYLLGTAMSAATMRMTRTMMLEVLRQDYIRTAWSKGLRERVVVMRHTVKNALIPVVTLIGLQLPLLIGGSVILGQIFVLPGIGRMFVDALDQRDYPVVSAINLIFATAVLVINLMIDVIYAFLDPRVRYQ